MIHHKTIFVDVMLNDKFIFTMPYKYCPIFKVDPQDIYDKVIERRPSLKDKPIKIFMDE